MNLPNPVSELSIDTCLRRDQHRLRRERDRLRAGKMRGNDITAAEAALAQKIAASAAARAARAASVPKVRYPEELPISANRDEIRRAIEKHAVVILCGETGSGKELVAACDPRPRRTEGQDVREAQLRGDPDTAP